MRDYFDEDVARGYDAEQIAGSDLDQTVSFLAELANGGPVLEFAIGTGRMALPLAERGLDVTGIEYSKPMIDQMRAKPGGESIPVVIGDMARTKADGQFSLVFLVFNTICNLTSQEAQIACFQNAADHLAKDGHFVIETFVPPIQRLPYGECLRAFDAGDEHWGTDEIDIATQGLISHHVWVRGDRTVRQSVPFRYVWPSELDLMARIAGMDLVERWESWGRTPFTSMSESHVSVWMKV